MGTWYALWRISILGQLLHIHSAGVPVVWMLSSSGMEATISFFLNFIKARSPEIMPTIIMTDRNQAQMNAITAVYLASNLLLCWWHVLRAMRMHFHMEEFPELWERVCELVKTSDQSRFDTLWEWIQTDLSVPKSFLDYLKTSCVTFCPTMTTIRLRSEWFCGAAD